MVRAGQGWEGGGRRECKLQQGQGRGQAWDGVRWVLDAKVLQLGTVGPGGGVHGGEVSR